MLPDGLQLFPGLLNLPLLLPASSASLSFPLRGLISASSYRSSVLVSPPCCSSFSLFSGAAPSWTARLSSRKSSASKALAPRSLSRKFPASRGPNL